MFKSYYILFIFAGLILDSFLFADTWPVADCFLLSSSFGEFRNGRIHAGIDVKTDRRTGFPVRAYKDGIIFRISCQLYGYGKAMYILHEDKTFSVYGHLDQFENKVLHVEDILKEEQDRKKSYFGIDLTINDRSIKVKEGQVIAYSGETGAGFPHLHFELRSNIFTPINPMQNETLQKCVKDTIPPEIRKLVVFPLYSETKVNGRFFPAIYSAVRSKPGEYRLRETVYLNDPDLSKFLFSLEMHDTAEGSKSKLGIHSFTVKLNGNDLYKDSIDSLDYRNNTKGWLYFNQMLSSSSTGCYYFNILPDYRQVRALSHKEMEFPASPVKLEKGLNKVTVTYVDHHNNQSVLSFDVFYSTFVHDKKHRNLAHPAISEYFNDGRFSRMSSSPEKVYGYSVQGKKLKFEQAGNYLSLSLSEFKSPVEILETEVKRKKTNSIQRKMLLLKQGSKVSRDRFRFSNVTKMDILMIENPIQREKTATDEVVFLTEPIELFPKNLYFGSRNSLEITFDTDGIKGIDMKKAGLFSFNTATRNLSYTGDGIIKGTSYIKNLKSFDGHYIFAVDQAKPVIRKVYLNKAGKLFLILSDSGKGIDWLKIDVQYKKSGISIPGLPDPDRMKWESMDGIERNTTLVITVRDLADNLTVASHEIR